MCINWLQFLNVSYDIFVQPFDLKLPLSCISFVDSRACHPILTQKLTSISPSLLTSPSPLQLSAPGVAASHCGWIHEHAQWQPCVVLGNGEWSPGTAGITHAGRSAAAGFLQSVRGELWGEIFIDAILPSTLQGEKIHPEMKSFVSSMNLNHLSYLERKDRAAQLRVNAGTTPHPNRFF